MATGTGAGTPPVGKAVGCPHITTGGTTVKMPEGVATT